MLKRFLQFARALFRSTRVEFQGKINEFGQKLIYQTFYHPKRRMTRFLRRHQAQIFAFIKRNKKELGVYLY